MPFAVVSGFGQLRDGWKSSKGAVLGVNVGHPIKMKTLWRLFSVVRGDKLTTRSLKALHN